MAKLLGTLLKGSLILLIAFNLCNVLNFFFQFSMARLLTVSQYGTLASLFSIIYILTFFSNSIQTIITKYTSSEGNNGKLKNILRKSFRKGIRVSIGLFLLFFLVGIFLSIVMKIPYLLICLTGFMIFVVFLMPITRGIMQGRKKFKALGVNMIIEAGIKLGASILLVLIGWNLYGAIIGVLLGSAFALIVSFIPLRKIVSSKEEYADLGDIYQYSTPVFFILLAILLFYSLDVILAKVFFSSAVAGAYAISSTLAKIIFAGTAPISKAMFPLSAEKINAKKDSKNIFLASMAILTLCLIIALIILYFIPNIIVHLFSGKSIPDASSILFYLGVAISLISISNLILFYKLSIRKTKGFYLLFIFVALEVALFYFFSSTLIEFSVAFIISSAVFLLGSIFLVGKK